MIGYYRDDDRTERAQEAILRSMIEATEQPTAGAEQPPAQPPSLPAVALLSGMFDYGHSYPQIIEHYLRNFTGRHIPKSRPVQALNVDIVLSPEQAAKGGHLPLRIPIFNVCDYCEGTGRAGFFTCDQCGGEGIIEEFRTIDVLVPARLRTEMVVPISLRQAGVQNLYLNLRLRPSATPTHT